MSLAKGIKRGRLPIIRQHREAEFEDVFDKFLRGEVSAEKVTERGNKLKRIRGKNVS